METCFLVDKALMRIMKVLRNACQQHKLWAFSKQTSWKFVEKMAWTEQQAWKKWMANWEVWWQDYTFQLLILSPCRMSLALRWRMKFLIHSGILLLKIRLFATAENLLRNVFVFFLKLRNFEMKTVFTEMTFLWQLGS